MLGATMILAGVMAAALAQRPGTPEGPPPGQLIDIGGHVLHLHCTGPVGAGPTVIFESGGGAFSTDWKAIQALLGSHVRTCAYDRAGSGWSEAGPTPRTLRQEVFELHALLETAKVPGPYVLVGHSIGGLLVRLYAEKYATNVAGMVLVDPTHESGMLGVMKYGGWVRLREKGTGRPLPEPRLGPGAKQPVDPDTDYLAEEMRSLYLAGQANPQPLGGRPLVILAGGKRKQPPGTPDDYWKQLKQEREEQVAGLAQLSSNSKFIRDPESGHALHRDNPQLVVRAIQEVLEAIAKGAKLSP